MPKQKEEQIRAEQMVGITLILHTVHHGRIRIIMIRVVHHGMIIVIISLHICFQQPRFMWLQQLIMYKKVYTQRLIRRQMSVQNSQNIMSMLSVSGRQKKAVLMTVIMHIQE